MTAKVPSFTIHSYLLYAVEGYVVAFPIVVTVAAVVAAEVVVATVASPAAAFVIVFDGSSSSAAAGATLCSYFLYVKSQRFQH